MQNMFADTFRFHHRTIGTLASIWGFLANATLLFFVIKSKHPVKQIFIQMAIVDVTFLFVTAATEPLIVFSNGNEFMLQNGFFRHLSLPLNGYMITLWIFGLYFSISSICVQFIFRYLLLCKNFVASTRSMFAFLLIPIILSIGMAWIYHAGFAINNLEDETFATETLKDLLLETGETNVHVGGVSRKGNKLLLLLASCAVGLMTLNYIIIGFCVWKIQGRLRILHPTLTFTNRRMQSQISQILFIQATSPLVVSIIPLGYLCYVIISGGTAFWSTNVLTMGFSWVPFTNAIVTMTIIREFRPNIFNLYKLFTEKIPSQLSNIVGSSSAPWITSNAQAYIGETSVNNHSSAVI